MALFFYVIKVKQALFSKLTCCNLSNFFLHEISRKKKALFQKDICEKPCVVVKSYWWHMEKMIIYWEIIMSHNPEYYVKSLKRNKVKSSNIRELRKKKKYSEENVVPIHWQILQLLILAVPVHQVNQKRQFYQTRRTYCLFSLFLFLLIQWVFVKFCFSEIRVKEGKICLNCKETHFSWFF